MYMYKTLLLSMALISTILLFNSQSESNYIQTAYAQGNSYFNEEFIKLAEQGYIKGVNVQIGTTINELIKNHGKASFIEEGEGSKILIYEGVGFHYSLENTADKNPQITAIDFIVHETTVEEMISNLGEPVWAGNSSIDELYTVVYDFKGYELWAVSQSSSKDDYLDIIMLKKS